MGVSSVCVEEGERRSEEEVGRSVGRRSSVGGRSAGAAPKVRTPHNDVGKNVRFMNQSVNNLPLRTNSPSQAEVRPEKRSFVDSLKVGPRSGFRSVLAGWNPHAEHLLPNPQP